MEGLVVLAVVVGAIVLIAQWRSMRRETRSALEQLGAGQRSLEEKLAAMERWVTSLEELLARGDSGAARPSAGESHPSGAVVVPPHEAPSRAVAPPPPPELPPAPLVPPPPTVPPAEAAPPPQPAPEPSAPLPEATPPADWPFGPVPEQPLPTFAAESAPPQPAAPAATAAPPEPPPAPRAPPPPSRRPQPRTPPPPSPLQRLATYLRGVDWEQFLGVKLLSIMGGVLFLFGVVYLIKLSYDHGLITPHIRLALSVAFGVGLVVVSETRWAQGYRVTMQALCAAGIAVLFAAFFAAHALWGLIPPLATFALLALVAATAVLLSIRRSSLVVALLGLLGGFSTPILLSTGENKPFGLFGYLLLLNVALAWVAHKQRWPILSALSLLFTLAYQGGWAARFLDASQLPIAIGVFLIFPLVGFAGIALGSRRARDDSRVSALSRWSAIAGALPPSLLALYVATRGEFAAQWPLVMAFAVVVAAGLAAVAAWQGPEWLHLAGGATVLATLAGFLARTFDGSQWPLLAAFLAAFVAVYLGTPLLLARLGRDFRGEGRHGVLAAPLVLSTFVVVAHATEATPLSFLVPLLVLTAACAGVAVLRGDGRVHLVAALLAIAGEATWSAVHLDGGTLYPALVAYAAFAGVFLGGPLLAERLGRPLAGAAPGPLLLASLAMLFFPAGTTTAGAPVGTLVGITLLAALLQSALFARATRLLTLGFAAAGVVIGFLVLALWAEESTSFPVFPALLAVAALAAIALAGGLLARVPPSDQPISVQSAAPHLALAAYAFVAYVAAQRELALGSAAVAWLGLLLLLDLGFLAAALLRRRPDLLPSAAAGSIIVLLAHELGLGAEPPAPAIACGAALAAAAFFLGAYLAARRTGNAPARGLGAAGAAALVALHGGQLVLWIGASGDAWLPAGVLAPAHAALGLGLLALAWLAQAEAVALTASLAGAVAAPLLLQNGGAAPEVLWLATPAWLLALAYPLVRGARGRSERLPLVGTVVASAVYLLVARKALIALGAGPYQGALPVVQAFLLVPHLVMLLRMEPPSQRDLGRLAMMAAAVLGLVTVAIPLQLDKQWWTIGWALLAAALGWLWTRIPHRGLLGWAGVLLAACFVRLVPFPHAWIFDYHARGQAPILNWYLYTYAVVAAAFFAAAWCFARRDDRLWPGSTLRLSVLAAAGGALLVFLLVNIEIADFWTSGEPRMDFRPFDGFGATTSYTVAWAAFAAGLLAAFRRWRHRLLLGCAVILLAACFLRLLPIGGTPQLDYRGATRILNWYLVAYGAVAAAFLAGAWLLRGTEDRLFPRLRDRTPAAEPRTALGPPGGLRTAPFLAGGGVLLLFFLVNVEIADFFGQGAAVSIELSEGYRPHLSYTVAWALTAVALVVLFRRARHRLVLLAAAALLLLALIRLRPFGSAPLFAYDRTGHTPILNGFLPAYVVVAIAMFAVARLLAGIADRVARWVSILSVVAGTLVVFFLVNVEIADYWSTGSRITFRFSAGLAPDLTYTLAWAVFAVLLLVAGIAFRSRGARGAALALLIATVLKGFVHDLSRLTGFYRVASFFGLGVSVVLVAMLFQRFVIRRRQQAPSAEPVVPAPPESP